MVTSSLTPNDATVSSTAAQETPTTKTAFEQSTQAAAGYSVWVWLAGLALVFVWAWVRKLDKVADFLDRYKALDALCDVFGLGFVVLIGIDGLRVLNTKLAAARIPLLSRIAAFITPLYT